MSIYTRTDYMNNKCSHHEYYAQAVNESVLDYVKQAINEKAIANSTCEHFNDIPLKKWDNLHGIKHLIHIPTLKKMQGIAENEKHFLWSPCNQVCIAKAAARIIKEGAKV